MLQRSEVGDLINVARSIPVICNSPRYSPSGKASVVVERAAALALGLECIFDSMGEQPSPAAAPELHPAMSDAQLAALTWHATTSPERNYALRQLEALPRFVAALARCEGVSPEDHAPVITAYIVSILRGMGA